MSISTFQLRKSIVAILVVYWIALLVGTHWPHLPSFGPENTDKVLHCTAYGGLACLLALSVFGGRQARWWNYLAVLAVLALAGGLDELTQPPFQRTADWYDWYADLAGIALGLAVAWYFNRYLWRRLAS